MMVQIHPKTSQFTAREAAEEARNMCVLCVTLQSTFWILGIKISNPVGSIAYYSLRAIRKGIK